MEGYPDLVGVYRKRPTRSRTAYYILEQPKCYKGSPGEGEQGNFCREISLQKAGNTRKQEQGKERGGEYV